MKTFFQIWNIKLTGSLQSAIPNIVRVWMWSRQIENMQEKCVLKKKNQFSIGNSCQGRSYLISFIIFLAYINRIFKSPPLYPNFVQNPGNMVWKFESHFPLKKLFLYNVVPAMMGRESMSPGTREIIFFPNMLKKWDESVWLSK